jgi:hypothetical protein
LPHIHFLFPEKCFPEKLVPKKLRSPESDISLKAGRCEWEKQFSAPLAAHPSHAKPAKYIFTYELQASDARILHPLWRLPRTSEKRLKASHNIPE